MSRITRYPPKPKPQFVYEVAVHYPLTQHSDFWEVVERIAGPTGYKKRASSIIYFDTAEKALSLERWLADRKQDRMRVEAERWTCPIVERYERAAATQHAVIWGLSTGIIEEVVRVYRRERAESQSQGSANWAATKVILAFAPAIEKDRARELVTGMLEWIIKRQGEHFWVGLRGEQSVNKLYA